MVPAKIMRIKGPYPSDLKMLAGEFLECVKQCFALLHAGYVGLAKHFGRMPKLFGRMSGGVRNFDSVTRDDTLTGSVV
jgi:hypothetical protein